MARLLLAWNKAPPAARDLSLRKHAADVARREMPSDEATAGYRELRKELAELIMKASVPGNPSKRPRVWRRNEALARALNLPTSQRESFLALVGRHLGKPAEALSDSDLE
eukprot:Hpha_TRINITY_DN20445_c0_g1::TRINITY_DN20445_c0_g1_i1::g.64250::m.64250